MSELKKIGRFSLKILLFAWPIVLLIFAYFIFDPFHVLKYYKAYPDNYLQSYNRNRISTQEFLNHNQEKRYRSFVFGSSRSSVFYTQDWGTYIGDSMAYHFDASNESISGIHDKLVFIEKQENKIENALLIFDNETFDYAVDSANSIIHIPDWRWSPQNRFSYHLTFFKAFFKDMYFLKYFDLKLFKTFRPYMYGAFENKHMLYTPVHNDFIFQGYIDQIKEDSMAYYSRDIFYERTKEDLVEKEIIKAYQIKYLQNIKAIFDRNNTHYKIVFGPNYDQKKVNPKDLTKVKDIFDQKAVYDFTGKNEYTQSQANYYEIYHYKPAVARAILKQIYQ